MSAENIPADDPGRELTVAHPGDARLRRIFLAGDVYTILVAGDQTAGRYCLIDMHVLDGGGPPPHRHDFEEMFTLLEGELEVTFRGQTQTVRAPATINIPANAPHSFRNTSGQPAHMLCMCAPAGQDAYFLAIGDILDGPDAVPPHLTPDDLEYRRKRALELAPRYRTEMLS